MALFGKDREEEVTDPKAEPFHADAGKPEDPEVAEGEKRVIQAFDANTPLPQRAVEQQGEGPVPGASPGCGSTGRF